jgi:hypothetical protein
MQSTVDEVQADSLIVKEVLKRNDDDYSARDSFAVIC